MKKYRVEDNYRACTIIVVIALLLSACGADDESATSRTKRLLKSTTWKLNRLTIDGVDKTSDYAGMTLTVSENTYTSNNGEPIWPTSGTWKLIDKETIERDNGETVRIDLLEETKLTLSLDWQKTTYGEGRLSSIKGAHVFEFIK